MIKCLISGTSCLKPRPPKKAKDPWSLCGRLHQRCPGGSLSSVWWGVSSFWPSLLSSAAVSSEAWIASVEGCQGQSGSPPLDPALGLVGAVGVGVVGVGVGVGMGVVGEFTYTQGGMGEGGEEGVETGEGVGMVGEGETGVEVEVGMMEEVGEGMGEEVVVGEGMEQNVEVAVGVKRNKIFNSIPQSNIGWKIKN